MDVLLGKNTLSAATLFHHSSPANDAACTRWLDPTPVGQMASPQPEGDLRDHTSPHSSHLKPIHPSHLLKIVN